MILAVNKTTLVEHRVTKNLTVCPKQQSSPFICKDFCLLACPLIINYKYTSVSLADNFVQFTYKSTKLSP